jgi:hypothetical protein
MNILCEGCGSISVKNNCYVNISILKWRVKNLFGINGKSISIYVTFTDMLPHTSHNIGSCFTNCFTSDFS